MQEIFYLHEADIPSTISNDFGNRIVYEDSENEELVWTSCNTYPCLLLLAIVSK